MPRLMPLLIVLAGTASGLGLGLAVSPTGAGPEPDGQGPASGEAGTLGAVHRDAGASPTDAGSEGLSHRAYVKLGRQIVVPIVRERRTEALMLFELALDVPTGMTERAYAAEPRLRDAFLQTLLRMSYTGAFTETYTDERITRELRDNLRQDAQRLLAGTVFDVLILDMLRQEL